MTRLGIALSAEQHGPNALVDKARRAEEIGLEYALLSDHFHPWLDGQDESSFAWTTLGGIARETDDLEVGTGVTCPTIRYHPAIIAQAAATTGDMMDGRFFLGVGTGENLNEHITAERWPAHHVRLDMLEEAIEVIRELWDGEMHSHYGDHYTVEDAKIYTMPDSPPDIHVAASGKTMAEAAGEIGDGLVSTAPKSEIVETFDASSGGGKPHYAQMTACYAPTKDEAKQIAYDNWRNGAVPGELGQELPTPKHFEQAAQTVEPDDLVGSTSLGTDPDEYIESIQKYADAGFENVFVHQVNPDAEGFFEFFESEVLSHF